MGNTSEFSMVDTDGDALADAWEKQFGNPLDKHGIDVNEDGMINLELPNADPNHKDIFVELDAMAGHDPSFGAIADVVVGTAGPLPNGFENAPKDLVQNPDLTDGINLHPQFDDLIVHPAFPGGDLPNGLDDLDLIKAEYFGTAAQHSILNPNGKTSSRPSN